jgi:serine/threonine protein kinase
MATALDYLHNQRKICHRDFKCENILVDHDYVIRLIDFGLVGIFSDSDPVMSTVCGSPEYAAPEMIMGEKYTAQSDIWSLGIVLYAMLVGSVPFNGTEIKSLYSELLHGEIVYPDHLSPPAVDLIQHILVRNPDERFTLPQILSHAWTSKAAVPWLDRLVFDDSAISEEIVEEMRKIGYDVADLAKFMADAVYNDVTVGYRILSLVRLRKLGALAPGVAPGRIVLKPIVPNRAVLRPKGSLVSPTTIPTPIVHMPGRRRSYGSHTQIMPRPSTDQEKLLSSR